MFVGALVSIVLLATNPANLKQLKLSTTTSLNKTFRYTHSHTTLKCKSNDAKDSTKEENERERIMNRRFMMKQLSLGLISTSSFAGFANVDLAYASPPMKDAAEADNLGARMQRSLRPKPAKLLRQPMTREFAVLLMRCSYNALDQLDCVAMDQFQRDFFFIRQAEYQTYVNALGPGIVQQGELTDPNYFDFISFAQYTTISRDVSGNPPMILEEQQPVTVGEDEPQRFENVIIRRKDDIPNEDLPIVHSKLVGEAILDRLNTLFQGTASAIPAIPSKSRPDSTVVLASVKQLMNLFIINGFAWDGSTTIITNSQNKDASGTEFQVKFAGPATWWSGQSLQKQNSVTTNDFFLKTVRVLLDRAGYSISKSSVKYTKTEEITTFTLM